MRRITALFLTLTLLLTPLFAKAEESGEEILRQLTDLVRQALKNDSGLHYEEDEENGYFFLAFEPEDSRLGDIFVYVDVYTQGVLVLASCEQVIPQDAVSETIRFINLINSDLLGGKYYLLPEDGSLYYEVFLDSKLLALSQPDKAAQDALLDLIYAAAGEMDYDVEYFMELIHGEKADNVFAMYYADY